MKIFLRKFDSHACWLGSFFFVGTDNPFVDFLKASMNTDIYSDRNGERQFPVEQCFIDISKGKQLVTCTIENQHFFTHPLIFEMARCKPNGTSDVFLARKTEKEEWLRLIYWLNYNNIKETVDFFVTIECSQYTTLEAAMEECGCSEELIGQFAFDKCLFKHVKAIMPDTLFEESHDTQSL